MSYSKIDSVDKVLNSKETASVVSSVLEAAAQILTRVGYRRSTTNHIAQRAGVSIGSLYYYFKGKDAVYQKLADEVMHSYVARLERKLGEAVSSAELHEALVSEVVDFTFENRDLLRSLFSLSPQLGKMEAVYNLRNQFADELAARLAKSGEALDRKRAFVLVNAINGVLDNYIYGTTCPLDAQEMKRELGRLVAGEKI